MHISIAHQSSGCQVRRLSPRSSHRARERGESEASNVSDAGAKAERLSALALNDEVPLKCSDLGAAGRTSLVGKDRLPRRPPAPPPRSPHASGGASDSIDDAPLLSVRLPCPGSPRGPGLSPSPGLRGGCATRPSPSASCPSELAARREALVLALLVGVHLREEPARVRHVASR